MKMVFLILIVLIAACGQEVNPDAGRIERENTFAQFQGYVDQTYPGWKVVALRDDERTFGEDGDRHLYYVALAKDGKQRVVAVASAEFTLPDGSTETRLYWPVKLPVDTQFDEGAEFAPHGS